MLVHHSDPKLVGVIRAANLPDRLTDDDITSIRQVITHDAFNEGAFPRTVLAQQRVKGAGLEFQGDMVIGDKGAEPLRDVDQLKTRRLRIGKTRCHEMAAMNDLESATAPNTPPCIFIICNAAR